MPKRIQLSRAKGWRKPEDVVVVSRPTRWGNPSPGAVWYAEQWHSIGQAIMRRKEKAA